LVPSEKCFHSQKRLTRASKYLEAALAGGIYKDKTYATHDWRSRKPTVQRNKGRFRHDRRVKPNDHSTKANANDDEAKLLN
jgi:hypothetical protein